MGEWITKSMFELGTTYTGLSGKKKDDFGEGEPYVTYLNVFHNCKVRLDLLDFVRIKQTERQNKIQKGDALFTTSSETPEEVGMSSVVTDDIIQNVYLNSFCFGYRLKNPNEIKANFLAYLLRGHNFRKEMLIAAQGSTRHNLSKKNFYSSTVLFPVDVNEQEKISQILSTIDAAIAKTKAIIEKYKSIKEGLMQNLLANGIDENGVMRSQKTHKYKDSPLGKIPVEWDAVPILRLGTVSGGSTPKTNEASNWGETHVWITPNDLSNISGKYIFSSERKITDKGLNQATRQLLPPNSFIISCRAPVGYCAVVKVPFSHNQGCKSIVPNELIISEYLYYSLVGKKASLERVSSGTTFLELPKKELESFLIAVPQEIKEQEAIISCLNSIDSKIEIELRNLSKYQAIKNGLMQDLLTHKVPVDPLVERSVENE